MWQDYALMLLGLGFAVALGPLLYEVLYHNHVTNSSTALLTASLVATQAFTFASLGLIVSAITTLAVATIWAVICYKSYINKMFRDETNVLELQT